MKYSKVADLWDNSSCSHLFVDRSEGLRGHTPCWVILKDFYFYFCPKCNSTNCSFTWQPTVIQVIRLFDAAVIMVVQKKLVGVAVVWPWSPCHIAFFLGARNVPTTA